MTTVTTTPTGQADASLAGGAAAPKGTDTTVDAKDSLSLSEINTLLGKNYPDKDTALKSVKDTFSWVGKKLDAAAPTTDPAIAGELRAIKNDLFYAKNPQYDTPEYREVISKMGENPADVVGSATFKSIFDKTSGYDKIQKTKTVLESNPRIGAVRNKMTEAKEALKKDNNYDKAKNLSVAAVLESLEE